MWLLGLPGNEPITPSSQNLTIQPNPAALETNPPSARQLRRTAPRYRSAAARFDGEPRFRADSGVQRGQRGSCFLRNSGDRMAVFLTDLLSSDESRIDEVFRHPADQNAVTCHGLFDS